MSDLGRVLELLHDSPSLWRTLRAEGIEWTNPPLAREAFTRGIDELPGRLLGPNGLKTPSGFLSTTSGSLGFISSTGDDASAFTDGFNTTETWKLWMEQPDRRRVEFEAGHRTVTAVWVGDTWWSWAPNRGAMTNAGDPHHGHGKGPSEALVETQTLVGVLDFEALNQEQFLGRDVVRVRATPRPQHMMSRFALHGLGSGADDYLLSVDAERGVILRSEARLRDQPFKVIEMTDVTFDESLPPDTFASPVPADEVTFAPPGPADTLPPFRPAPSKHQPWMGPPPGFVGGWIPWQVVLAATSDVYVALNCFAAFPTGLSFDMVARIRPGARPRERTNTFMLLGMDAGFRFEVAFSDGRKAEAHPMAILEMPSATRPDTPLLSAVGPGGGDVRQSRMSFWLWPLPPPGPITWVLSWEEQGVPEQRITLDASEIVSAAGQARQLWEESGNG